MKVLVVGASGMLGSDLILEMVRRGHSVEKPSSKELDITDPMSVAAFGWTMGRLDWAINCAAYTAVDKAESEPREAAELNTFGPSFLAASCRLAGIKLVHVSTDFVFDGSSTVPYETNDETNPLGVYGRTKLEGEEAVRSADPNAIIVRTSWLFGPNGNCFPKTMIRAWDAGKSLRVIADQTGCPTYTVDLARVLVDMVELNAPPGIYHATGPTITNWHAFAMAAIQTWKSHHRDERPVEVAPISTADYPTPAQRPKFSVLSNAAIAALGIEPMRTMPESLAHFVRRL